MLCLPPTVPKNFLYISRGSSYSLYPAPLVPVLSHSSFACPSALSEPPQPFASTPPYLSLDTPLAVASSSWSVSRCTRDWASVARPSTTCGTPNSQADRWEDGLVAMMRVLGLRAAG